MNESAISLGRSPDRVGELADEVFLRAIRWRRRAPAVLVRAAAAGDVLTFASRLAKRIRRVAGSGPRSVSKTPQASGRREPADGIDGLMATARSVNSSLSPAPTTHRLLTDLLEFCDSTRRSGSKKWFRRWRALLTDAVEWITSRGWPPQAAAIAESDPIDLTRLRDAGELPWLVGLLFGDLSGAGKLQRAGRDTLHAELLARTDSDGSPHSELLTWLPDWVQSLVRCVLLGRAFGEPLWKDSAKPRFRELVRRLAALSGTAGKAPMTNGRTAAIAPLLSAAADAVPLRRTDPSVRLVHSLCHGTASRRSRESANGRVRYPAFWPGSQSDWARLACLRNGWSADADRIVVTHQTSQPRIEASVFGQTVLRGAWTIDLRLGGQPINANSEWTCVCWHSDDDGDYLELQQNPAGGMSVERQVFLSRDDHWLLMADVVSGCGEERIDYSARFPLAADVALQAERETREIRLRCGRQRIRVFPLPLPDDRILGTPGALTPGDDALEIRHAARGGLWAPVVFDWHPARRRAYAEWRQLTVAEEGRRLKPAEAWAHRLRVGHDQWLVFRGLTRTGRLRSVLGHHTPHETVIGRFASDGAVEPLLLVE